MSNFFLGLLGIAVSWIFIKYRQVIGDMIGDADWMQKIGGVYNIVVLAGVGLFFWSLLVMFNLTDVFLAPLAAPFSIFGFGQK